MSGPVPPQAPRRPHRLVAHGDVRVDDWYWLREREDPAVRAHLEAENAYAEAMLAPLAPVATAIYEEIRGRVLETDESAPVTHRGWIYSSRTIEGEQYAVHVRRPAAEPDGEPVVVIDENAEAHGHTYFDLGTIALSPDHTVAAYTVDLDGSERYTLRFRDLTTGADLPDVVADVTDGVAWADDGRTCFYLRPDEAMRPAEVRRHVLGTSADTDPVVRREDDERFFLSLHRTRSGRFVLIESSSKTTSEVWFIPTESPAAEPRVVAPREPGHEYTAEHHWSEERGDRFLILTNQGGRAPDYELVAAPCVDPARQYWTPLVPHRPGPRLDEVHAFAEHIVLCGRVDGLDRITVLATEDGATRDLAFPEPVYTAWVGPNPEFETGTVRIGYTSLTTPPTDFDEVLATAARTTVRVQPVLGGYEPGDYTCRREWAVADDGTRIPISLVHRRDVPTDGTAAVLLTGYGAYEISDDPEFRASRLPLLDRGVVFAIAHIRGGGELGRAWYEAGRLEHKENTVTDFVACAEHLVGTGIASPRRLAIRGGSAGGLLMGAVANLRPELFAAIVAQVPFVDVLTTMLDPDLPLTVTEWEEWGDPSEPEAYARFKRYSPYDNVTDRAYPTILVTSGLNDPRVQYWEPTKWVARLRAHTTSGRPILLRTELGAGHGGPSGRYDAWREESLILAFVLDALGVTP
ncbi:MAG: S9 family peptidase [Actinomycetota bacterium]